MAASGLTRRKPEPGAVPSPEEVLGPLLDDLTIVLLEIPPRAYMACPAPGVSGSIGAQVRHTLDHVSAFLAARAASPLSYDRRERGTAVEVDPSAALRQLLRLKAALQELGADADEPLEVASTVSRDSEPVVGWSTRARELAFVVSHTIHHQAIIALLLVLQGLQPPAGFGVAPSTPMIRGI